MSWSKRVPRTGVVWHAGRERGPWRPPLGRWRLKIGIAMMAGATLALLAPAAPPSPAARIGERLFFDPRFARPAEGAEVGAMSCAQCHAPPMLPAGPFRPTLAFCDARPRSPVPARSDGRTTTPRNSPTLVGSLRATDGIELLHYDGEFAAATDLVVATFLGRSLGWLPEERAQARRHFATVIRNDRGAPDADGPAAERLPYAVVLQGTDAAVPEAYRLPAAERIDCARAADEEIVAAATRHVVTFLRSLQYARDERGEHDGSPYDAFLAANRLPRAPQLGETAAEYGRRLGEAVAALRAPKYIDLPARRLRLHDQAFRFGETELRGLRIFLKAAVGDGQRSGAGNCAECHVPPEFTDLRFHNTGVTQDEYDRVHGDGRFAALEIPTLGGRETQPDRWLPPTAEHPSAKGVFARAAAVEFPGQADLGLWNVYANPDMPVPQAALRRVVDRTQALAPDAALARTVGRFKTASLRDLGQSAPYFHTGGAATLEETVRFYRRMSDRARRGEMRNAPPEFFPVRLGEEDEAPLVAFLRALNEDYTFERGR